jgi:cation transport ATPase
VAHSTHSPHCFQTPPKRMTGSGTQVQIQTVPLSELQLGDIILVRPGERVPADGTVVDGPQMLTSR